MAVKLYNMSIETNKKKAYALAKDQRRKKWKHEMIFKKMLNREGIQHVHQKPFYTEHWFYVGDFYIPKLKMLIELDGSSHKGNKLHDTKRTNRLAESRKVQSMLRVKNSDIIQRPRWVYQKVIEIRNRLWDGIK